MKVILFDGYGTLFEGAFAKLLEVCGEVVRDHGLDMTSQAFLDAWDVYFFPLIRGEAFVSLREAHHRTLPLAFRDLGLDRPSVNYIDDLIDFFGSLPIFEDVKPTLNALNGLSLGVVSNADDDHLHAALKYNDLTFSVVVSSESARSYKPNPDIFFEAFRQMGCVASEVLYVGDDPEDDVVGARNAGIRVAWLNRTGKVLKEGIPTPDYEIQSLSELPELIQKG